MEHDRERRESPRLGFTGTVEFTPYRLLMPHLEDKSLQGTGVDQSADERGLCFMTSHPLFTGRRLRLVAGGVARTADVRWVAAVAEGYRAGVALSTDPQ